jgi:hypothetical protein
MMAAHSVPAESGLAANDLRRRAQIAASAAASGADAVDRDRRFPSEAFSAAKAQRLRSIVERQLAWPVDAGGARDGGGAIVSHRNSGFHRLRVFCGRPWDTPLAGRVRGGAGGPFLKGEGAVGAGQTPQRPASENVHGLSSKPFRGDGRG